MSTINRSDMQITSWRKGVKAMEGFVAYMLVGGALAYLGWHLLIALVRGLIDLFNSLVTITGTVIVLWGMIWLFVQALSG
jgi:hypothetical protein